MNSEELANLTEKRLSNLTAVELLYSMEQLDDYPMYRDDLLDAIRGFDTKGLKNIDMLEIGAALLKFLHAVNYKDIMIHEGL